MPQYKVNITITHGAYCLVFSNKLRKNHTITETPGPQSHLINYGRFSLFPYVNHIANIMINTVAARITTGIKSY